MHNILREAGRAATLMMVRASNHNESTINMRFVLVGYEVNFYV